MKVSIDGASLIIRNSSIVDNDATLGGGLNNQSDLTVINSIIARNDAFRGGGLYNDGNLTVINSTISNNSTNNNGGGFYNNTTGILKVRGSAVLGNNATANGGGFYNDEGGMTVTNSTVAGNKSRSGGGHYNDGVSTLRHVTLSNNSANQQGGGVYNSTLGSLTITNSLIANSPAGMDCFNNSGSLIFKGINLIKDGSCNVVANGGLAVAPKLRRLLDNGGASRSIALRTNSPAKNAAGSGACRPIDQRGANRPQGATCDIGAFELILGAHSSVKPIISFFNTAVANGELAGTGAALGLRNDRRAAIRQQILLAGDLIKRSKPIAACQQLNATLRRIDTDNAVDGNDYVTGLAGAELAQKIKDLRASLGCG